MDDNLRRLIEKFDEDYPPVDAPPDVEEVAGWLSEGGCYCPDGCWVEPDGQCTHGLDSWALILGLI